MDKRAFITGITGQDGSYLAEFLLEKGYKVFGLLRRSAVEKLDNIHHILKDIELVYGDLVDQPSLYKAIKQIQPHEVYNLGAMSFVKTSWDQPEYTMDVVGIGQVRVLEAVKEFCPTSRVYFAGSSEQFGKVQETPQTEKTPFYPRSPYGIAKLAGYWTSINYRESYNIFAANGILFNHDSPRRSPEFVTRKITLGLAKIKKDLKAGRVPTPITLGNLYSKRDFGYAKDYVKAMWLMLQHDVPDNFVIASGHTHSIYKFLTKAMDCAGFDYRENHDVEPLQKRFWMGTATGPIDLVTIDEKYYRPAEVDILLGDASKAKQILEWSPEVDFNQLVKIMVEHDLRS